MNHEVYKYVPGRPEPEAYAVDAFSISWKIKTFIVFLLLVSLKQLLKKKHRQSNKHSVGTKLATTAVLRNSNEDVENRLSDFHKEKTFTFNTTRKNICTQNIGQTGLVSVPLIRRSVEDHQLPQNVTHHYVVMEKGTTKQYIFTFSIVNGISIHFTHLKILCKFF